jgi:hypothetical protein
MNKTNWFLGAFIFGAMFLFACSSPCNCNDNPSSSSSVYSSSSLGNTVQDQVLVKKNIKLSVDSSYADIDGEITIYAEIDANNLSKIDLIAYKLYNDSIYHPIGSNVFLFEIPDEQAEIFKNAKTFYEILDTWNYLAGTFNGKESVGKIPIVEGKVFFVSTSEEKYRVVIIKLVGNQSVDLEIIEIPIPGH